MKVSKIISCPVSLVFYLLFGLILTVFHPIQWICLHWMGYEAHKKSVDILNWTLMRALNILGTQIRIKREGNIPAGVPLIIVSNHQSQWDVPLIIWYLRKCHPKFIAKQSLGKGIPSVSYNLRHGGSVLINRHDAKQSTHRIIQFAEYLEKYKRGGVIFPEGTRSTDGTPLSFRRKGLCLLLQHMPDAYIVPVTINNSWQLQRWGNFPLGLGVRLEMQIHKPLKVTGRQTEKLIDQVEETIISNIIYQK